MRALCIICLLFSCQFFCISQGLLSESKLWSNLEYGSEAPAPYIDYYIKLQGDTLINEALYKKVFRSDDSLHSSWISYGFMREDSLKRVYAYQVPKVYHSGDKEQLVYDFNLKKGDSILTNSEYYVPIDSVGSIILNNKQLKIIYIGSSIQWIEGIGSLGGILSGINDISMTGEYHYLVCFSDSETIIFQNKEFSSCFVQGASGIHDDISQKNTFMIARNSDGVFLAISGESFSIVNLSIYDISGKLCYKGNFNKSRINLSEFNLPSGFYIFDLYIKNQRYTGKVIF